MFLVAVLFLILGFVLGYFVRAKFGSASAIVADVESEFKKAPAPFAAAPATPAAPVAPTK
jgi:hypothetical protein